MNQLCFFVKIAIAYIIGAVMDEHLYTIDTNDTSTLHNKVKQEATNALESGKIIYFPDYYFALNEDEQALLSESILNPKHKNISYDYQRRHLAGVVSSSLVHQHIVHSFMHRFAEFAKQIIGTTLPQYQNVLKWGRTSYRPAEIRGRKTSKRKDDTRIHVDSFASTPVNGLRILRVFCNINPYGEPRVWQVGEAFAKVLKKFAPTIAPYNPFKAKLLKLMKATKTLRSAYDHYMLQLHDQMKLDNHYQQTLHKTRIDFPPHTTWIVFTDHVSHAALSGQFLLEQTFYLAVEDMAHPHLSPRSHWETFQPSFYGVIASF